VTLREERGDLKGGDYDESLTNDALKYHTHTQTLL
jgi:hypothetical protein